MTVGMQVIENGKIVDSSSIVPVRIVNDVTGSRATDGTEYYNTSDKTLYVSINILAQASTVAGFAFLLTYIDGVEYKLCGIAPIGAVPAGFNLYDEVNLIIAPSSRYSAVVNLGGLNSALAVAKWIESY